MMARFRAGITGKSYHQPFKNFSKPCGTIAQKKDIKETQLLHGFRRWTKSKKYQISKLQFFQKGLKLKVIN